MSWCEREGDFWVSWSYGSINLVYVHDEMSTRECKMLYRTAIQFSCGICCWYQSNCPSSAVLSVDEEVPSLASKPGDSPPEAPDYSIRANKQ